MNEKRNLLVVFFLSIVVGWTLGYLRFPYFESDASFWVGFLAGLGIVLLGLLFLFFWKKNTQLVRWIGNKTNEEKPIHPLASFSKVWFLVAVIILLGAGWSSFLIYQQNHFFKKETIKLNQKIVEQSVLLESTKNSNLVILQHQLFEKIGKELKDHPTRTLSDQTIEEIAALNYSFQPSRYWDGDQLSEKKLSKARGQLLLVLATMDIDSISFSKIKYKTTFAGADLRGANLRGAHLSGLNLRGAHFQDADLRSAHLSGSDLRDANFWGANMRKVNLEKVNLKRANLSWANLDESNLNNAQLNGANFSNAKIRNAFLKKSLARWTSFKNALLNESNFTSTDFLGADLNGANLSKADLTKTNLYFTNLINTNFSESKLLEVNLAKAVIGTENWLEQLTDWKVVGAKHLQENYKLTKDISGRSKYRLMNKKK